MPWEDLLGHDENVARFARAVERDRLASTFLFVGPHGIGKRAFASELAAALLCERNEGRFTSCGACPACVQVRADAHPDVIRVAKPPEKSTLPLELLIGDRESRNREGLCHQISLTPYSGKRKVAIIDDADYLGPEGANCLLKTLEEPPPRSLLILIGSSVQRQLPTILSRCQVIHFRPLSNDQVATLLRRRQLCEPDQVEALAALSEGSVATALENADLPLHAFRRQVVDQLSRTHFNALELARDVTKFVDEAGKEAPKKRARLIQLARFLVDFYRGLMRRLSGAQLPLSPELEQLVDTAARSWRHDREAAARCADRSLMTLEHIAASGNLATIIESWFDELYRLSQPAGK